MDRPEGPFRRPPIAFGTPVPALTPRLAQSVRCCGSILISFMVFMSQGSPITSVAKSGPAGNTLPAGGFAKETVTPAASTRHIDSAAIATNGIAHNSFFIDASPEQTAAEICQSGRCSAKAVPATNIKSSGEAVGNG